MAAPRQNRGPACSGMGKEDVGCVSQETDRDAINYGSGVADDKARLDSTSNEEVLPDYVMLDFADDFVSPGEEAYTRRTISDARPRYPAVGETPEPRE